MTRIELLAKPHSSTNYIRQIVICFLPDKLEFCVWLKLEELEVSYENGYYTQDFQKALSNYNERGAQDENSSTSTNKEG